MPAAIATTTKNRRNAPSTVTGAGPYSGSGIDVDVGVDADTRSVEATGRGEDEVEGLRLHDGTAATDLDRLEPGELDRRRPPPPLPELVDDVPHGRRDARARLRRAPDRGPDVLCVHVGVEPERLDAVGDGSGDAARRRTVPRVVVERREQRLGAGAVLGELVSELA